MTNESKDVLEQNVSTLLESGGEHPRIAADARTRIREALLANHGATTATPARMRARTPLYAVGFGLAATAAAALIVTRLVGDEPQARVDAGSTTLSDGSTYITEPEAKVTVLGPRRVRVEGAALLDVAPGKGTFVVETARGTIEVLGTRFLVDAEADRTTAAVVRGKVKLASEHGSVELRAGEQAVAEPGRPPTRGPAPRLSHLVSWAQAARRRDENGAKPIRHGSLFARDPGVRPNGQFGEEYPLPIKQLTLDVVVEDRVARVALDQTFQNPRNRVLEGVYKFAIPPDAALQRLAMYVDGTLTESAVVERMRARRIYEELVYRRIDPALLEYAGTGRLNLRVYPIPALQDKRLMIAYTQSLPQLYRDWTLTIPLPEVDEPVGEFLVSARIQGCGNCELSTPGQPVTVERSGNDAIIQLRRAGSKIGDSFVVHVRDARKEATVATKTDGADRYLMVRAPVELGAHARTYRPRTWVLVDDVSASRGQYELMAQADLVDAFLRELDEDDRVAIVAFDVEARTKLAPTRVADVDRRAVRQLLAVEGGVGATDFGKALEAATAALAGVNPEDALIIYLGDGVITSGSRSLETLRTQLVGRARFVGVGVGDGPDTQTLEALAAATGGYATTIDLADDVRWRAFDLVATLHTSRVTGITARLLDASGALVPATAYLRSPQLADGEETELVAKLAGSAAPTTLELTGTRDGAAWTQRIALAAPTNADAGYLPRQWAQHHIAARLLAKHEPVVVPVCAATTTPCKTENELRTARDEEIRQEVVMLGKQYFLLSRHTSLLVLENDAMYAKYGVRKGSGDTWARYAMPAKIQVVTAPTTIVPDNVADDAELLRVPLQVFYDQVDDHDSASFDESVGGTGFGMIGTRGRGSGTGQGFGVSGAARGGGGLATGTAASRSERRAGEVTRGSLGLATEARERPAGGDDADRDPPMADSIVSSDTAGNFEAKKAAGPMKRQSVSAGDLQQQSWGGGLRSPQRRRVSRSVGYGVSAPTPAHFNYVGDRAFDDLSALIPALMPDAADEWRTDLVSLSAGPDATFPIDAAAKQQLATARAKLGAGIYRWGDLEIAVDGARRFGWRRTTDFGLGETASYDGGAFTRRYVELGISATRAIADDDVALSLAYLPILIAEPEHYARYFVVSTRGPREVGLSIKDRGKDTLAYVLRFDDSSRLVAITDATGIDLLAVTWGATGPTAARLLGGDVPVSFAPDTIADATQWAHGASLPGVTVELPIRLPRFWQTVIAKEPVGSPAWRHAQRQLIVSGAALPSWQIVADAYTALREHKATELGDFVLASGGIVNPMETKLAAAAVAQFAQHPLGRYVLAARKLQNDPYRFPAPATQDGMLGALWTLRTAVGHISNGESKRALELVNKIGGYAPTVRLLGIATLSNQYNVDAKEIARLWESVAHGELKNVARAAAAQVHYNRGNYEAAAELVVKLATELDLTALPPRLDVAQYAFSYSRRGQVGWQLAFAQWRERVLAGSSFDHVMSLLSISRYRANDMPIVLERAAMLAGDDVAKKLIVARAAVRYSQPVIAHSVLEPMLKTTPTREVLELAASMAQSRGNVIDAFEYLERAQDAGADEAVDLTTVRTEMRRLLALAHQAASQSAGAERAKLTARAVTWGTRWRAIDPGNDEIDRSLGALLLAMGDSAGAWRQLSSVIERDPWSGPAYATVAEQLEQQGKVHEALELWHQAMVIDQTNPTHRLRKAQALIAIGKSAEGDALLEQIATSKWHDMWLGTVYQAKNLLERAKQTK